MDNPDEVIRWGSGECLFMAINVPMEASKNTSVVTPIPGMEVESDDFEDERSRITLLSYGS